MGRLEELKKKKHELNEENIKINNEIYLLEQEGEKLLQEKLKVLVGHAFKTTNGDVHYVYTVPPREADIMGHSRFNPYQIPVLSVSTETDYDTHISYPEISTGTLYSRCCDEDDPLEAFRKDYMEIGYYDFMDVARTAIINFMDEHH